ncbi:uncharacterized protein LOC124414702 [Diprion similis]|uniref:uncharacterized protein LOC124414702 n=1 Tax=Diprion similis TaxID=362088 RepID=UPI001EF81571|nr:uncharacterized protein LOC124414702 [Diprion similis]
MTAESEEKVETQIESHDLPYKLLHMARVLEKLVTIKNKPMLILKQLFMKDLPVDQSKKGYPVMIKLQVRDNISEDESVLLTKRQCIEESAENTLESHDVDDHPVQFSLVSPRLHSDSSRK